MLRTSLRSVWHRRRRVLSVCLAVMIGVAFLAGTLVLGDTLKTNFDRLFAETSAGTSVVVRNATAVQSDRQFDADRGLVDESLVARVRAVPGVADAQGQVTGYGLLVGRDGSAVGGNGPPRMAGSWITDPVLNPYRLVQGRAPAAPDEVVVNRGAARAGHLHVGDTTTVQTPQPVTVHVVGIATFGDADGFGQATFTAFTLASAQANVAHQSGRVSSIVVRAQHGVAADALRDRISRVLPSGVQAITGKQLTNERIDRVSSAFLNMLRAFLIVFASIALVVAALSINNTFSITVAQRTRELALMRAVGASRRQVRVIVTLEALVIGAAGALVGLVAGLGVAGLLKGMFDAFGFALPAGGLSVHPSSLAIAFVVGVVATLVAAQLPARRASSVAPVAALAETSAEPAAIGWRRTVVGAALGAVGVTVAVVAAASGTVALAGVAALALVTGSLMLAPVALGPAAHAIGAVLGRIRRTPAAFAEQNARRNPRRTAATATALVVGVAVVSLFTLFVASLEATLDEQVQTGLRADLVVSSPSFGGGRLSPSVATELARSPLVTRAVGLGEATFLLDGRTVSASVSDTAQIGRVMRFDTVAGSVSRIGDHGIAVSKSEASRRGLHVGSPVALTFGGGARDQATVRAVYDGADLLDDVLVPDALWARHTAQPTDTVVLVTTRPGVSFDTAKRALDPVATHNGASVQNLSQYASSSSAGLDTLLGIVYVMLALAVLIALLGIANTLSLAVYERRRELGLLRAVGQTRAQLRSVLRFESVIVSTFGTVVGLLLGGFLGWVFAVVAGAGTFSLPVTQLAVVAVLGALAGVLAAIRPARRAARLPVLDAIGAQ
ncbi:MAG TPA: FtsX-like permease family protein [Acidimicrobiia bacterium]|nr:FtsX-like permease family protein [Acidimicrobiia bacterium]